MSYADRTWEAHRRELEKELCDATLKLKDLDMSKTTRQRFYNLFKQKKIDFPTEKARMAEDLKRRNGVAELMKYRVKAGKETAGTDRAWAQRGHRSLKHWRERENEDREWVIRELEDRVGNKQAHAVARQPNKAAFKIRKLAQRNLYKLWTQPNHGGIPEQHALALNKLFAIKDQHPEVLEAAWAARNYIEACRRGDKDEKAFWLDKITCTRAVSFVDSEDEVDEDDDTIEPPSSDEEEFVWVSVPEVRLRGDSPGWRSASEEEDEGGVRLPPEPVSASEEEVEEPEE